MGLIENILENNKEKLLDLAMKKFLKPDDESLIAWKGKDGKPDAVVFQFNIKGYIEHLEESNKTLNSLSSDRGVEIIRLRAEIRHLKQQLNK